MLYDSDDDDGHMVTAKWHCDLVRKKISEFIATKAMTQSAFQKEIGVSPPSYYSFMRQKGKWNGSQNGTFWGATRFFTAREKTAKAEKAAEKAAMATMPAAEKKRKREADAAASSSKKNSLADLLAKVRAVDDDEVSSKGVYDMCDEVRKKSLEFMASTGMTQTAFLREIASTAGKPTPVAPNSWGNFIKMKSAFQGHNPGAGNRSYPEAYYFLEKVRLVRGEPKSMKRRQAEEELVVSDFYRSHPEFDKTYGRGGYKLKNDDGKRWVKLPPGHSMPSWPPSFEDFM